MMKKLMVMLLSGLVVLTAASCQKKLDPVEEQTAELPNPWVKVDSLEKAYEQMGNQFKVPEYLPEGYQQKQISVMEGWLAEITYAKDGDQIVYRVCLSEDKKGDISGVYEEYEHSEQIVAGDASIIVSGDGHTVSLATWEESDYSHSLHFSRGLELAQAQEILDNIR